MRLNRLPIWNVLSSLWNKSWVYKLFPSIHNFCPYLELNQSEIVKVSASCGVRLEITVYWKEVVWIWKQQLHSWHWSYIYSRPEPGQYSNVTSSRLVLLILRLFVLLVFDFFLSFMVCKKFRDHFESFISSAYVNQTKSPNPLLLLERVVLLRPRVSKRTECPDVIKRKIRYSYDIRVTDGDDTSVNWVVKPLINPLRHLFFTRGMSSRSFPFHWVVTRYSVSTSENRYPHLSHSSIRTNWAQDYALPPPISFFFFQIEGAIRRLLPAR